MFADSLLSKFINFFICTNSDDNYHHGCFSATKLVNNVQTSGAKFYFHYEIKSKGLVRLIYQSCGWDRTRSYRLLGVEYPQHRLVNYDLSQTIPIFEGRIDKETQEAQKEELL